MLCFRYRKLLIPYSESELGTVAARKLERHLMKCARCRMELDGIRLVAGALCDTDAPAMEPAGNLWARVSARIADEPVRPVRQRWFGLTGGLAAGAAAVLVAVIGMRLLSPGTAPAARDNATPGIKAPVAIKAPEKATRADVKAAVVAKQPGKPVDMAKVTPTTTLWAYKKGIQKQKSVVGGPVWFESSDHKAAGVSETPRKKVEVATNYSHLGMRDADRARDIIAAKGANKDVADGLAWGSAAAVPARPAGAVKELGVPVVTALGVNADGGRVEGESKSRGVNDYFYGSAHVAAPAAAPAPGAVGGAAVLGDVVASAPRPAAARGLSAGVNLGYYAGAATSSPSSTSVVDDLNETEGIRTAAIFSYP